MIFSQCASSVSPSPTLSLNEKAKKLQAQGKPVINLGVGEPKNLTPITAVEKSGWIQEQLSILHPVEILI